MMANIAKAALKIPWKKIAQTVVPVAIEHVLDRVKRRKPARERMQKPTPDILAERVDKLEDDLEASLEAARSTSDELGRRIHDVGTAAQVLTARLTIALAIASIALAVAITALVFLLLRHS
jgi:hypothetical protein